MANWYGINAKFINKKAHKKADLKSKRIKQIIKSKLNSSNPKTAIEYAMIEKTFYALMQNKFDDIMSEISKQEEQKKEKS